jgi:hypothetical protein
MSAERIAKARKELEDGKLGRALGSLLDIKDTTGEPEALREVHSLAVEGLAKAGRFSKAPWKSLISKTEEKLTSLDAPVASAS